MRASLGLLALTACFPDYPSIEAACPKSVGGEEKAPVETVPFLRRLSCFRRYVNLEDSWISGDVQEAAAAHANYLELNGVLDPASEGFDPGVDWLLETVGRPGFTGADPFERLAASGAAGFDSFGTWHVLVRRDTLATPRTVDDLVTNPWFRDALFQPLWRGAGLGLVDTSNGGYAYMDIMYTTPPVARVQWPIVFPKDGMLGVPTSYRPWDYPDDPTAVSPLTGFPITITVGSWEPGFGDNPYALTLQTATFTGPSGELAFVQGGPGNYGWGSNQATLVIVPVEPLDPFTTYTLDATISWSSLQGKQVTTTFTTNDGSSVYESGVDFGADEAGAAAVTGR